MSGQATFALRGRNPDVLTCIANLSNDEVFTPPELAHRMLDTLADFLGLADGDEIIEARQNGESLVEVAEEQGVEESELTGFMLDRLETRLADAVESGRITQEEADEKLANAPDRLGERINSTEFPPEGKFGEGRFGKGRWGHHHVDDHHTKDDTATP